MRTPAQQTTNPRVRLASPFAGSGDELPFRILVIDDLAARRLDMPLGQRAPRRIGSDAGPTLAALRPCVDLLVPDRLGGQGRLALSLLWTRAAGMDAAAVVAAIPELARLQARRHQLLAADRPASQRLTMDVEAALLGEALAAQAAAILDHDEVRRLDAAWRCVDWLCGQCDPAQGVELCVLPATREEVEEDLDDAPDPTSSGLWRTLYADEYGQHGGRPWSALLLGWPLGASGRDLALLRRLCSIAAQAHVPVLADAAPGLLRLRDWTGLPEMNDPASVLDGPGMASWQAWRQHDDARHAVLALPAPWLRPAATAGGLHLPGRAAAVLAARLAACHARARWCADAAGWGPGHEVALPAPAAWPAVNGSETPTAACLLDEVQSRTLAELGLAVLCPSRRRPAAAFPALPTLHRDAAGVPTPLPLMLIVDRIAHHLKVLSRERLGGGVDRDAIERELGDWLGRHVADGQVDDPLVRASRPLRGASVRVHDVPGRAGWLRADLQLRPHLPGTQADIELSLASRIDRGAR